MATIKSYTDISQSKTLSKILPGDSADAFYFMGGKEPVDIVPIYGFGALILYFIGKKFNKNIFETFISSLIICTIFEYISSFILEVLFHHLWWDYSNFFFNINGRVCLSISLCWGLLGVVFIEIIEPLLYKIYSKVNKNILSYILILGMGIYLMDTFMSIINNFYMYI